MAHRFLRIATIGTPQVMLERVFCPAVAFRACQKPSWPGERGGYCPSVRVEMRQHEVHVGLERWDPKS